MSAYLVAAIDIEDWDTYQDYVRQALASLERAGAQALAITDKPVALEGTNPGRRFVVIRFPSQDALRRWYDSDDYAAVREIRFKSSTTPFLLSLEGLD